MSRALLSAAARGVDPRASPERDKLTRKVKRTAVSGRGCPWAVMAAGAAYQSGSGQREAGEERVDVYCYRPVIVVTRFSRRISLLPLGGA